MNENEKKVVEQVKYYETSELSFAAYCRMKGLKLIDLSVMKNGKKDRFNFVLEDLEKKAEKLRIDFVNSESHQFDSNVRLLKMMITNKKKELENT